MRSPTALLADEQHQDALALEFVGIDVKKSQLAPARPSAPSTTASARKTNRWGVGIDAPAAGARDFFPIGFAPTKPAREAIDVFHAFGATSLDELASSAQSKASFLGQVGMTLPSTHVLTIQAYTEVRRPMQTAAAPPTRHARTRPRIAFLSLTPNVARVLAQESPLYTELNATCRAATHTAELKLKLYRDYLYHMEQARARTRTSSGLPLSTSPHSPTAHSTIVEPARRHRRSPTCRRTSAPPTAASASSSPPPPTCRARRSRGSPSRPRPRARSPHSSS